MKIEIDVLEIQNYCDIASFIYQINSNSFYGQIKNHLQYTLDDDRNYQKEYEKVYEICETYGIVIVGLKFDYNNIEHTIGLFGDYKKNKIIILDEVSDDTLCKYGYIDTAKVVDIITDLRGKPRCNRIGE